MFEPLAFPSPSMKSSKTVRDFFQDLPEGDWSLTETFSDLKYDHLGDAFPWAKTSHYDVIETKISRLGLRVLATEKIEHVGPRGWQRKPIWEFEVGLWLLRQNEDHHWTLVRATNMNRLSPNDPDCDMYVFTRKAPK